MPETVTYLEMTGPEELNPAPPVAAVALTKAETGAPLIRELCVRVGRPYGWRSASWTDEQWAEFLADPSKQVWFVTHDDEPAGVVAYELRPGAEVEITKFGLVPEFVGRGIGGHALTLAIRTAWSLVPGTRRVWLHTSSFDHPNALPNYRKRGLRIYRRDVGER
jgi:RimJ/RimL family protein N-acetyltransferase